MTGFKNKKIMENTQKVYYEVPREQILGISFIRWYNITAKLYELNEDPDEENSIVRHRTSVLPYFNDPMFNHLLYVNYSLFKMAINM